jgi:hypothetical protein
MTISSENIAQHLSSFGYSAKAGSIRDKATGEPQPVVFINGLGTINAYLNLSPDPAKFGLKVFGNLQPGYSPVVFDAQGNVVRETVRENGEPVTRAVRGQPLDEEALKKKNIEIGLAARKDITAAVLAAYMLEVGGGDLQLIREGFRLQKWERSGPKTAVGLDESEVASGTPEASAAFSEAAAPEADKTKKPKVKRAQGPSHP